MITVDLIGGALYARSPFTRKDELKAVPGARWDAAMKMWRFPANAYTARELAELPDCRWTPDARALLQEQHAAIKVEWPSSVHPFNDPRKRPWSHQIRAFKFAAPRPGTVLRLKMRMGKTLVSLALAIAWDARLVLVVCPVAVMDVWRDETEEHVPGRFRIVMLDDKKIEKKAKLLQDATAFAQLSGHPLLAVTNYESVWRSPLNKVVVGREWDLIIADEGHKLKSSGSKVSMFMARSRAKRRLHPTGTFLPNGVADAYGQMRFVDPSIFGTSAAAYRARYRALVEPVTYKIDPNAGILRIDAHFQRTAELKVLRGARWVPQIGWIAPNTENNRALLDQMSAGAADQMKDFTVRLRRAVISIDYDEADIALPEQEDRPVFVDLSPAARDAYEAMRQFLIAEVERGEIVAANALVKSLRLSQIASGIVETDDGETVILCDAKARALDDLLDDWIDDDRQPVVVFCRFINDLDRVSAIAWNRGLSHGEISGRRKDGKAGRFLTPGTDVVGVQLQSGGLGLDFYESRLGVFMTLSWNAGNYEQARYRFLGSRQRNAVTFPHIIARGTIDETIWTALQGKIDLSEAVMSHLRK